MVGYLGEIRLWPMMKIPKGWMACEGQEIQISTNQALYSLLGTSYGGDGRTYFNLPNFKNNNATAKCIKSMSYTINNKGVSGNSAVTLTQANIPKLTGQLRILNGTQGVQTATTSSAINGKNITYSTIQAVHGMFETYSPTSVELKYNPITLGSSSPTPVSVMQPSLAMQYLICVLGLYPDRQP